jgi:hypothetical protein
MGLSEFYDKQWMAVDLTESQYKNTLYLSLTKLYGLDQGSEKANIYIYRKPADLNYFLPESTAVSTDNYDLVQFSNISVDSKSNVHVMFYGAKNGINALYHSLSSDGGKTFSKEIKISNFLFAGGKMIPGDNSVSYNGMNPDRLYPCPQMAIDKSGKSNDGNIYVVWTAIGVTKDDNDKLNVYLSKSTDKGVTWSQAKIIHYINPSKPTCQYYPSIAVNDNGVLVISWYDRFEDANDAQTDYYLTYSFDAGETFVKKIKVTSEKSNFDNIGDLNQNFGIGEYNALLTTKGYAIPVWADGRKNNGDINVYTAFVPITLNGSSVESINTINADFELKNISPNPTNDDLNVVIKLDTRMRITLDIYNEIGEKILVVADNSFDQGEYTFNAKLNIIPSGNYFVRLSNEKGYTSKRFQVVK